MAALGRPAYVGKPREHRGSAFYRVKIVAEDIGGMGLLNQIVLGHDVIVRYVAEPRNDNSIANPEPFLRAASVTTM